MFLRILLWLTCSSLIVCSTARLHAQESDKLEDVQPVMVSLDQRDLPSDEEWEALHEDTERAGLFGSLGDLKSRTISFMDTQYYTLNCAEGTLGSYGKMQKKEGFDRYGHITNLEFDIPRNTWKERYVLNAAALVKLTGRSRFTEFAGVDVDTAVQNRRQIVVTFVGTIVPKDEAIRRLNADIEALEYLATLHAKQNQRQPFKLFGRTKPPAPKVVLANVVMLDSKSSKIFDAGIGANADTAIHGIGGSLKIVNQGGEDISLLTPVVRCYRTYSIEFKTDASGKLLTAARMDRNGRKHVVPIVFDLTPDL